MNQKLKLAGEKARQLWSRMRDAIAAFRGRHRGTVDVCLYLKSGQTLTFKALTINTYRNPAAPHGISAIDWTSPENLGWQHQLLAVDLTQVAAVTVSK